MTCPELTAQGWKQVQNEIPPLGKMIQLGIQEYGVLNVLNVQVFWSPSNNIFCFYSDDFHQLRSDMYWKEIDSESPKSLWKKIKEFFSWKNVKQLES